MEELYEKYNYPSASYFYQILKENNIKATLKQVKDFIEKSNVKQVTKKKLKIRNQLKYITASIPYEMFVIDLLDYQKYSNKNKGNKYILIAIDVFTRKGYAEPIKRKIPENVLEGLKKIIQDNKPKAILHDDGGEWKGEFKKYIDSNDIVNLTTETGNHNTLGIIDRFSRTLKETIYKHFIGKDTTNYTDILPKLIELYNNKPHSSIDYIQPSKADEKSNIVKISNINLSKQIHNKEIFNKENKNNTNKIEVGDYVRIEKERNIFTKGYEVGYTKKTYIVEKIDDNYAILDNGKKYNINKLMKSLSADEENKDLDKADKKRKVLTRLRREGLDEIPKTNAGKLKKNDIDPRNIIEGKRRKKNE